MGNSSSRWEQSYIRWVQSLDGKWTAYKMFFFSLESHQNNPWGNTIKLDCHWREWKITEIKSGFQSEQLGLNVGDWIFGVDDSEIDETNYLEMKSKLEVRSKCQIIILREESFKPKANKKIILNMDPNYLFARMSGHLNVPWWISTQERMELSLTIKKNFANLPIDLVGMIVYYCRVIPYLEENINRRLEEPIVQFEPNEIEASVIEGLSYKLLMNKTITALVLKGRAESNVISDVGTRALGEALKKNSTLSAIRLDGNQIGDNGVNAIIDGLKNNSTLTEFSLSGNHISHLGATVIGAFLKINTSLKKLFLSSLVFGNDIHYDGAKKISEGLKVNSTLKSLFIGRNNICDNGAICICESLKVNSVLEKLVMDSNNIGDEGALVIGDTLKLNSGLTELDITLNKITDKGATIIFGCLKNNSIIKELNIGDNNITKEKYLELNKIKDNHISLQKIENSNDDKCVCF